MVVTLSAQNEAVPVTISADVRSYPELAATLSAPGRHVTSAPELADRVAVVSLHNRPWSETRSILEKDLDVSFHQIAEGEWRIEESPEAATRKAKLYNAFLIESEGYYAGIFSTFRRLSHGQIPADQVQTKAMIDEQVRSSPPRPGTYEGSRLFATTAPIETIAALALLYGTASSDIDDMRVSGPTLYHMMKGAAMRRLIAGDILNTGDAYYWRNWQDMPEWIRVRATESVRKHEKDLTQRQDLTPQQKADQLDLYARGTSITHRLRFDPLRGSIGYEYSVLEDPSDEASNELKLLTQAVEERFAAREAIFVSAVKDQADNVTNKLVNLKFEIYLSSGSGWYDKTTVRALRLPMGAPFLKKIADSADVSDDSSTHSQATPEVLTSEPLSHPFTLRQGSTSLAQALVDFATETGTEVVASVPIVRDQRLNAGSSKALLSDIAPWLVAGTQDTQGQIKAWTAQQDRGVVVLRDEWTFLDEKYTLPLAPVLALGRASIDTGSGSERGIRYSDLALYARSVTAAQNDQVARLNPAIGLSGAAKTVPFINFLEKQPAKLRQTIFAALRSKDAGITIPLSSIALQSKLALVTELRHLCESDDSANTEDGATHHAIFHPWVNDFVPNGSLVIQAEDLNLPNRKMYRLSFSLRGQPRRHTQGSKTVFDTPPHLYYHTSGPIELPN